MESLATLIGSVGITDVPSALRFANDARAVVPIVSYAITSANPVMVAVGFVGGLVAFPYSLDYGARKSVFDYIEARDPTSLWGKGVTALNREFTLGQLRLAGTLFGQAYRTAEVAASSFPDVESMTRALANLDGEPKEPSFDEIVSRLQTNLDEVFADKDRQNDWKKNTKGRMLLIRLKVQVSQLRVFLSRQWRGASLMSNSLQLSSPPVDESGMHMLITDSMQVDYSPQVYLLHELQESMRYSLFVEARIWQAVATLKYIPPPSLLNREDATPHAVLFEAIRLTHSVDIPIREAIGDDLYLELEAGLIWMSTTQLGTALGLDAHMDPRTIQRIASSSPEYREFITGLGRAASFVPAEELLIKQFWKAQRSKRIGDMFKAPYNPVLRITVQDQNGTFVDIQNTWDTFVEPGLRGIDIPGLFRELNQNPTFINNQTIAIDPTDPAATWAEWFQYQGKTTWHLGSDLRFTISKWISDSISDIMGRWNTLGGMSLIGTLCTVLGNSIWKRARKWLKDPLQALVDAKTIGGLIMDGIRLIRDLFLAGLWVTKVLFKLLTYPCRRSVAGQQALAGFFTNVNGVLQANDRPPLSPEQMEEMKKWWEEEAQSELSSPFDHFIGDLYSGVIDQVWLFVCATPLFVYERARVAVLLKSLSDGFLHGRRTVGDLIDYGKQTISLVQSSLKIRLLGDDKSDDQSLLLFLVLLTS